MPPSHSLIFLLSLRAAALEHSFSAPLYQPSLICGALNIRLDYESCWGIFVSIELLSNSQTPSWATGGRYGLKIFQISILNLHGSTGTEAKEDRRKKAGWEKQKQVREMRNSMKMNGKSTKKEGKRTWVESSKCNKKQQDKRKQNNHRRVCT